MKDFAAIDFETANAEPTSVCAVGIVVVKNCEITDSFYSLIRPVPEYHNYWCTRVHGLTEEDTCDAPVFPEVWAQIAPKIEGLPLVAHNKSFDEHCLRSVFRCYRMDYPDYEFHCTLQKSRRVWPYGHHNLDIIAERCGYDLRQHHHALADAEACAAIAIKLFNTEDDPWFWETSEFVFRKLQENGEAFKADTLAEVMKMERKAIDNALKQLKKDGKVYSPKRGYYAAVRDNLTETAETTNKNRED